MERRKRTVPIDRDDDDDADAYQLIESRPASDPQEAAETRELARLVWEAAKGLDEKQYSLLDLHVRQGLDSGEIAQVLGVSKGNAYTMLSRLRDTFESAVAGLVMFERGRRRCSDLDELLKAQGLTAMSPAVRRLIDRHTSQCATCTGERRQLVSATALLRILVPLALPLLLRRRVTQAAQQSWETRYQQSELNLSEDSEVAAQPASGGLSSLASVPLSLVRRFPTVVWAGAAAAVIVMLIGVGAGIGTLLLNRYNGGGTGTAAPRLNQVAAAVFDPSAAAGLPVTPSPAMAPSIAPPSSTPITPPSPTSVPPSPQPPAGPTIAQDVPPPLAATAAPPASANCNVQPAAILGPTTSDASYATAMLDQSNQYRAARGQAALSSDGHLVAAAAQYADFVVATEWWLHQPPGQVLGGVYVPGIHIDAACHDMYDRAVSAGYSPAIIGENVMWGTADLTSGEMFSVMLSSDHEDPANPLFVSTGVACFRRATPAPAEIACVQVFGGQQ